MKNTVIFIVGVILGICAAATAITMYDLNPKSTNSKVDNHPVIIWNDDLESMPMAGSKVVLEMYNQAEDTIYIGSVEADYNE